MFVGVDTGLHALRITGLPNAKGAYPYAYPGLNLLYSAVEFLNKGIDGGSALSGAFAVRNVVVGGIGVKVVIQMHSIDVVATHNIHDNFENMLLRGRAGGVENGGGTGFFQQRRLAA